MAKCENCYHYEACLYFLSKENKVLNNTEGFICNHYKNKSLIVELPCKPGDVLYAHGCPCEPIEAWTILFPSIAYEENGYIHHAPLSSILHSLGKTVFLNREEAERALEEREKNG